MGSWILWRHSSPSGRTTSAGACVRAGGRLRSFPHAASTACSRPEWQFFAVLPRADGWLALAWWAVLLLRGLLPAVFAIAMGALVGAVQRGESLAAPLSVVGVVFVLLQVLHPIHQALSTNLGSRVAAWLYDRLTEACVRPAGMGHLEDPKLAADLTVAREFDAGMTGPPMHINLEFIAAGLVLFVSGLASAVVLFGYAWWAPLAAGRGLARHALAAARERGLARPQHRAGARGAAARGVRLSARRRSAARRRSCASSASPTGSWSGSSASGRACTSCSTRRRACGRSRSPGACCWSWARQRGLLLVARLRRGFGPARPRPGGRVRAGGGRGRAPSRFGG